MWERGRGEESRRHKDPKESVTCVQHDLSWVQPRITFESSLKILFFSSFLTAATRSCCLVNCQKERNDPSRGIASEILQKVLSGTHLYFSIFDSYFSCLSYLEVFLLRSKCIFLSWKFFCRSYYPVLNFSCWDHIYDPLSSVLKSIRRLLSSGWSVEVTGVGITWKMIIFNEDIQVGFSNFTEL